MDNGKIEIFIDIETISEEELIEGEDDESEDERISGTNCQGIYRIP